MGICLVVFGDFFCFFRFLAVEISFCGFYRSFSFFFWVLSVELSEF